MIAPVRRLLGGTFLALTVALMSACGGGGSSGLQEATQAVPAEALKHIQSVAAPANAAANELTVRAYATLAGDTGAMMSVRIDGVEIGSVEVRATQPQDYRFATSALKAGSQVDVVFTNDAQVSGADRNLFVVQIGTSDTAVLSTAPGVSFDSGSGAAAFDGLNVSPSQGALYANGALRFTWPEPNLVDRLTVRASAVAAGGVGAAMVVRVDGIVVGTSEVTSTTPADFVYATPKLQAATRVDVAFTNSETVAGVARALNVHYLLSATTLLRPTATNMKFDAGSGLAAFDGANLSAGQTNLASNGALRGFWPSAANMTDSLTVRVSATLAADTGPIVQILADEVLLGTVEVRSTTPTDITLPALPLKAGQRIEVRAGNLGTFNGQTRSLAVAYAISGKTVLQPATPAASSLDAAWPEPSLTDTLNVRARADLAGGVGALLQLYVDGVMVGATEVNSTVFADYRFAVPPMAAGRKVDLVYANDAVVDGQDRNLYVAYLTTGNTVLLPEAAGNVYDRGMPFDGADTTAGTGNLATAGALRITWPVANITELLTVRASATPAGGVGALMIVWVDGVAVSSVEVKSTSPADYLMPTTPLRAGSRLAITFANRGVVQGVERTLDVQYAIAGNTFVTPTTAGASYTSGDLSIAWPSANLTDSLVLRAYANLAGDVGAIVQLRVNGVVVGTQEVRSTIPADLSFAVPKLVPGDRVDVAYVNDGQVNGVDRNLYVVQIRSGTTAQLATATGVMFDSGSGNAAFDGVNVSASTGTLYANGALRFTWPEPNLTSRLTVRASSLQAGGVPPQMVVRVDGIVVGSAEVTGSAPADHSFDSPVLTSGSKVDVALANAGTAEGVARTLNVHYLMNGTTVLRPTDTGVRFDAGLGLAAYDGAGQSAGLVALTSNGALRGTWPAANMTDRLTLRLSASLAADVGPIVQVLADGVLLGTTEVRATTPTDFAFAALPLKAGQRIEVRPTNLGTVNGQVRNLGVAYAISGRTLLQAPASASSLDAAWPEANLTDTLNIRARGTPAGGVGPLMQVYVDGVMVGAADVTSTVFADYRFAVPPMTAGRKVDVVFANDAVVNGEDRNLYVAYLTTGNTVVTPNAATATYDRGGALRAFDGIDVIAGTSSMFWGGALRMSWPVANITEVATIRANATLAGNVGALMILWVDGVAVSSAEVRATTPTDYLMPTTPLKAGSKVAVVFSNRGSVDGVDRALNVQYMLSGASFLTTGSTGVTYASGDFSGTWPTANLTDTVTVRAYANLAGGVGAMMSLRVNGVIVGTQEVRSTTPADYRFAVPKLAAGSRIDVVYTNDATVAGVDRNLYVQYLRTSTDTLAPFASSVVFDSGSGEAAFDGVGTSSTSSAMYTNGALRFTVPAPTALPTAAELAASRFLQQASFGPTLAEVQRVAQIGTTAWVDEQIAMPFNPDMVAAVQSRYDLGDAYRPFGANYTPTWVGQRFWAAAATSPDQLRRRMGFALHQILMVSQADSNLHNHARAYAQYVDIVNRHALGNFRTLLEDITLSPAMGIYLSHMRNRPESPASGRMPDENFAREVMQLFTIGLYELNLDGSPRLDANGQAIETYSNDDVMALSKVFTGWSWAYPDSQLTEQTFRYSSPDLSAAADQRIDILPMKAYPGQHSISEKRLFTGKPQAVVLPAGGTAQSDLKLALDALFNHPNVGPFISRQLIQHLVSSNPSNAYVARVAAVFNNNGRGVRGDLAAVARAIVLDSEAVNPPVSSIGKLREPVARVAHWMRSLQATSVSGQYAIVSDLEPLGQRPLYAGSVFGYFRPGYVPPNTVFSADNITVPEMQIVSEATTAQWVNLAQRMAGSGLGWNGTLSDVTAQMQPLADLVAAGQLASVVDRLNLLLYAGRMSGTLKQDLMDAMLSVSGIDAASHLNRARAAVFLALASPEYLVQR